MPTDPRTAAPRFVSYLRVSTAKQGAQGLGVEAQREAVRKFVEGVGAAPILAEYVEVESGKRDDRPQLARALEHCNLSGARLVVAKLDRLSRDAAFLLGLQKARVEFKAADAPDDEFSVGILALVAQHERKLISERTKAALAAAKRRGTKLGNPNGAAHLKGRGNAEAVAGIKAKADAKAGSFRAVIAALRAEGVTSAQGMAREFNARGFMTPRGGAWTATGVIRLLARLDAQRPPA